MTNHALYQGKYFSLHLNAHGTEYVCTGNAVMVVPLDEDNNIIFIREPAPAFADTALLLPAGETEPGEPHADTANRELQEEIGFKAARLDFLAELRAFPKYLTVQTYAFLARDLSPSRLKGDEDYAIESHRVPLTGFESLIDTGRLHDACAISALYLARRFVQEKDV